MTPAVEILRVDPAAPAAEVIVRVARELRQGRVVAAPSDTVYGLLARPSHPGAVAELDRLKSRSGSYLVLVASWGEARALAGRVDEEIWSRLTHVWPGPVTVILPAATGSAAASGGTIALRMPASPLLGRLLRAVGEPLFSTSANRAGDPDPVCAEDVVRAFPSELGLVLDGGRAASGTPSTLVDLTTESPRIVRPGVGDAGPLLDPHREGA